jgi:hypothetical protein
MDGTVVWIAAEHWAPGQWNPLNDNSDVIVTLDDGSRWGATFLTFSNIETLRRKCQESGECLNGEYFWVRYPILVPVLTREMIERVIFDLFMTGEFRLAFEAFPPEEEIE